MGLARLFIVGAGAHDGLEACVGDLLHLIGRDLAGAGDIKQAQKRATEAKAGVGVVGKWPHGLILSGVRAR